jgi:hypothetical protein
MIEGMGWLEGLCPQPEMLMLANLCEQFGILPSQVKNSEDWQFLAEYAALTNLKRNYEAWHRMVENPEMSMPQDLIQYMLDLREQAKERYG